MEAGSIRQRSKSACFPGSVLVAEEFRAFGFSVRRAVPGIVGSIARVPKLSGSSTAVRPAASLAIARTLLSGQRTRHPIMFLIVRSEYPHFARVRIIV